MPARKRMTRQEVMQSLETLRSFLPKGSTVYTVERSVSRSRQATNISILQLHDAVRTPRNLSIYAGRVLGYSMSTKRGPESLKVVGQGLNMAKHTVQMISAILYDDANALTHQAL
ncbi:hypothetical protein HYPP_02639 [Hyphomicrobium sp. ghe19]|nr:hypothetical protein HYPP_02639 [Hyphomicrobium sp. ghe19]